MDDLYLRLPDKEQTTSPINPEETPNYWRFKLTLKPKDAIKFEIKERKENYSSSYLYDGFLFCSIFTHFYYYSHIRVGFPGTDSGSLEIFSNRLIHIC